MTTNEEHVTDGPGQGRPAGPGAESQDVTAQIGDRPPPDPASPAAGVLDQDDPDPPEANEPA